ncbi:hypothetical protein LSH36_281g10061 [Paralvinella palmiformis]|uniref:ETS domain-containing protein n=1 Tax=Paralvinella palmiformis TaxID=53620 RepID=A0AAD9JIZ8_9ANNE|nr:hypothetical protein LSH36_281g10061 [Paralvinella palmiformis]
MLLDGTDGVGLSVSDINSLRELCYDTGGYTSWQSTGEAAVPRLLENKEVEEYLQLIEGTDVPVMSVPCYERQCRTPLFGCDAGLEDLWNFEEARIQEAVGERFCWEEAPCTASDQGQHGANVTDVGLYDGGQNSEDYQRRYNPDVVDGKDDITDKMCEQRPLVDNHAMDRGSKPGQRRCLKLWHWLLWLLVNSLHRDAIRWEDEKEGIFLIENPKKIAKMWGKAKNPKKAKTSYEHMARAMRYYYKPGIMASVPGRRLAYRFGANADMWRKYLEGVPVVLQGQPRCS